ncbi:YciI family protein [Mycobacterium sp.]|uniref:YciI family protein n=1 Tax=Mycobacterium sp. TaxID=1785 RepID=UPI0025EF0496|nr:YciI family protein [Mycobacterium sp.]MBW0012594.1 transcription initiation protein [Mycobacterium sp.]
MQYFALLISRERELTPDEGAAEMAAYEAFHEKAASVIRGAIRGGDALLPAATGVRITGGPDAPVITDGPFAEGAEVAGGYYVFEAENLDDALALARDIPAAKHGAVEVWPMVHSLETSRKLTGNDWLALLLEPPASNHAPGTPEWEAVAARHGDFGAAAGDHIIGGAALHDRSTATTVQVRDGETLITDGPYAEGAEVASGFYLLGAADRDEAVKLAAMIPASAVQLRQLMGVSGL